MTDNILIEEFLNYLRFERHFSPHTAKCYAADLHQFCEFLVDDGSAAAQHRDNGSYGHGGSGGTATATVVSAPPRIATEVKQTLLGVDSEEIRRFLAFLRDREYCKST